MKSKKIVVEWGSRGKALDRTEGLGLENASLKASSVNGKQDCPMVW